MSSTKRLPFCYGLCVKSKACPYICTRLCFALFGCDHVISAWWYKCFILPIVVRVTLLVLKKPHDCISASEVFQWKLINGQVSNHYKARCIMQIIIRVLHRTNEALINISWKYVVFENRWIKFPYYDLHDKCCFAYLTQIGFHMEEYLYNDVIMRAMAFQITSPTIVYSTAI